MGRQQEKEEKLHVAAKAFRKLGSRTFFAFLLLALAHIRLYKTPKGTIIT